LSSPTPIGDPERHGFPVKLGMTRELVILMNEKEACHPRVCGDPERHGFPVKLGMTRSLTEVQNQGIG